MSLATEHAADLRRRAQAAGTAAERNYLLWLAEEWEKTDYRQEARRSAPEKPLTTAHTPPYRFDARWQGWVDME